MYRILIEKNVEKELKKLKKTIFRRVVDSIKTLSKNPRPDGCRKLKTSYNDYRLRAGDFRIIYEIDDNEKTVKILRVRHRKEVYKNL